VTGIGVFGVGGVATTCGRAGGAPPCTGVGTDCGGGTGIGGGGVWTGTGGGVALCTGTGVEVVWIGWGSDGAPTAGMRPVSDGAR
jgi:hypothetical protein